jgi:SAM-dependent methyltransferase
MTSKPTAAINRWDEFARKNANRYICTTLRANTDEFWTAGETTVNKEFLPLIQEFGLATNLALEIGCGVGRLAIPISRHFTEVMGIDVSPEMARRATQNASERHASNAQFVSVPEPAALLQLHADLRGRVDFIYSYLVMQHIEDFRIIESYVEAASQLLSFQGLALLQFDTRTRNFLYRLRSYAPDVILPWNHRRQIRRIRRTPAELELIFQKAGFTVVRQLAPDSELHAYLLRKNSESK